jgi:hypothetical protein
MAVLDSSLFYDWEEEFHYPTNNTGASSAVEIIEINTYSVRSSPPRENEHHVYFD